ncbi:efflux RND transporter permease subunit [Desulfonatronovibrio hydrogenovorans]|uniref:efflux RND transporter permease subunit n=1 Tax=Desulfonatronovibrio hydrogenovorans TaxID=53245 RepID=UPI00048E214A|nr:efflux RND transporter permease subunit [Desulfonatronovibrio hydrogenovorans]
MIWNLCIRRPVLTIVIFLVFAIFGGYGYLQMPVQENPDVEFPVISVSVVLAGAAPEIIEQEIIDPLEAEINAIEGLKELVSTAGDGLGQVVAEFELWRDQDLAAQDVRDAVERARRMLPQDAESPIVRKLSIDSQAIMWIALVGDERWDEVRLTEYADNILKPQLETLRGVGQVMVGGARNYAVRIRIDPEKLAARDLVVQDVVDAVQRENVDIPSGRIEGVSREFLIRTRGQFSEAAPFNDLIIAYQDGSPVRLSDVGQAVDDVESDRQIARFSGEPSVGLGIVKQTGANTVALADLVRDRVQELSANFPPGLEYRQAMDASVYIKENIRDLQVTILIAAFLVIFVVLAFLRSGRGTIVVALAIPTSLLIGLAFINVMGFSINVLTMLGLILVIGIVVDDAIVVLERSFYHMENGADAMPAARVGTTEVAFPALANSLSLAAVFIPVAFTGGIVGRFFFEFGLTVAVTVFASTFVALTLTPMLCSRLLRYKKRRSFLFDLSERHLKRFESIYVWILKGAFKRRGLVVVIALMAFGLGVAALMSIPQEFQADEDRSRFMLVFETPEGSTIRETDRFARKIEAELARDPDVSHQFLAVGMGPAGPGQPSRGISFVTLTPRQDRELHQSEVMQKFRGILSSIPDGRAFVLELTPGGVGGSPIEIVLKNPDLVELDQLQDQVMGWMRQKPEWFVGVRTNLELNKPQIDVRIDRERAAEMGVSVTQISNTLRYLLGEVDISKIERMAERYDVITDVLGRGSMSPDFLRSIYVRNSSHQLVSLDSLISYEETVGPSEIHRFNRIRSATISASTPPGVAMGDAVNLLSGYLDQELPPQADYELAGMSQVFEESFYYLTITIIFSIIFIYLVLAAQFESFIYPLTIMTSLPLATVGAFGSLWLMGMNFNVYAFIGLIMLMGLVTKNSILLIDYTNILVARGRKPFDAAQEAARERFRPVLMTACSTILGMMPIAMGFGTGGEARAPLGISIVAGLFTSTALTLIVIPVVYTLYDQLQNFLLGKMGRKA